MQPDNGSALRRYRWAAHLAGTAAACAILVAAIGMSPTPSWARGGRGGDALPGDQTGGAGAGSIGDAGNNGLVDTTNGGGGGGGGGATGGLGAGGGAGGHGGVGSTGQGGDGGVGGNAGFDGDTLNNSGTIVGTTGGNGAAGTGTGGGGGGGEGGFGAVVLGQTNVNSGQITGGDGGNGGQAPGGGATGADGDGGVGVYFPSYAPILTNQGTITGGNAGHSGGGVIDVTTHVGGLGGSGIVGTALVLHNLTGTIVRGGDSIISGGAGINGLQLQVDNAGAIDGGNSTDGNGGVGINAAGLKLTNTRLVIGGTGGRFGGDGVFLFNDPTFASTIVNSGAILGGAGTGNGSGGAGINVEGSNVPITNLEGGVIQGGGSPHGNGGNGIIGTNATIDNRGVIAGNGGITGVVLAIVGQNFTILNSGTIDGGISLSGTANSLTITSTSQIMGPVTAGSPADTFGLGGDTNGTFNLSQLGPGQQYQGFEILQKSGASTWTVSGMPGASLAYQVTGGTLDLGGTSQTAASLLVTGGTLAGGTLTSAGPFDVRAGSISAGLAGSGALTKSTPGTVTLSGVNTYTGATTISGGTLLGGAANTFSPVSTTSIARDGTLDLGGFGQTINTVALDGGTLRNGTLTGAVTSTGGTVDTLGGPASITTTSGLTTAAGTNTYTGATAVNGGTLRGGAANAFSPTSATSIAAGGTLDLGGYPQTIDAVALNGGTLRNGALTGAVTSTGGTIDTLGGPASVTTTAGLTTALGANTYTGGTTINAGTLQLGNGGTSGSIIGNVTNNGNLAFNRSDTYAFAGVISGTGHVEQNGTGTTVLTAANTYTGATTINAGTLQVDGSIASPNVTVNTGGILSGTGKIGDPIINAGGTLAPGNAANPYGTLTIVGPLTFAPGSFYNVNITPGQNSRTNVVGTTTIQGGTVNVAAGQGSYGVDTRYTILNATAGVTGTFAALATTTNLAFLSPKLTYDADNVVLTFAPNNPIDTINPVTGQPVRVPDYTRAAATRNQFNVAAGLTQAGIRSGGRGPVLRALNQLTTQQARNAFDGLSGEGITGAQNVAFRSTQLFTSAIFDQTTFYAGGGAANSITLTAPQPGFLAMAQPVRELADLPARSFQPAAPAAPNRTWRAWATGFGGIENISGNARIGSAAQRNDVFGGALGVDYQLTPNYLVGVAVGGSNGDFRVNARGTSGSTTGGHIAIYDLAEFGPFYGASSTSFSYFGNQTTRFVSGFGGLGSEQNRGNFNSNEFRGRMEFGRHFASLLGLGGLPRSPASAR